MVFTKTDIFRKGQAATEYIIILSIVVIIALVVVGLLRGVLTMVPGIQPQISKIECFQQEIVIVTSTVYSNGTSVLMVSNNIDYTAKIIGVGADEEASLIPGPTISPGQQAVFSFYSPNLVADPDVYYTHEIFIRYTPAQEPSIRKTASCKIYGLVEPSD